MGGYQAGYYGYMWSEVLALDMRSAFGANVMDAKLGTRYRKLILERGGERPPSELVEKFCNASLHRTRSSAKFLADKRGSAVLQMTHRVPGLVLRSHTLLPLNYAEPGQTIRVLRVKSSRRARKMQICLIWFTSRAGPARALPGR